MKSKRNDSWDELLFELVGFLAEDLPRTGGLVASKMNHRTSSYQS